MTDVAIVGMACIFPGAPDLATYRKNLRAGFDAIADVPSSRWDPVFYDPKATSVDRFYCKRGGFVDGFANFDPASFGITAAAARGAEPDQLLTLEVATRALGDAGYDARPFAREKTGVVIGRGNYAGAARTRLEQQVRTAEQIVASLRALLPDLSESDLAKVKREFQGQLSGGGAEAAIGLVPNLVASRLSNLLDLNGPAFTIDAACASSLVAVDQACAELTSQRCDMMLVGGVHLCHDEAIWSVFSQLGALSRSQQIRPFDRRADGLLIGEGIGVVVLKRREDAERDDDRIYAVIRGTGVASDGGAVDLLTPRVEGQLLALERAWSSAALDRETVGLIEAHGAGTRGSDGAELTTLARFFGRAEGDAPRAALGSVKSMIGHTMPAAGIAGLIKAAIAVHDGVILPSIHCEEPVAAVEETRFRVATREEAWESRGNPRRAGINAFGFGGINAHVVIEEHARAKTSRARPAANEDERVALFSASSRAGLLAALEAGAESGSERGERLAIIDPTPARIGRAKVVIEKGRPWRGREGIWYSPSGLLAEGGKMAFVFPGLDASFEPRVDDVAARFGLPVPPCTVASGLEELGIGIVGVNRLLHRVLGEIGISADRMCGHSVGEWSGMVASGIISEATLDDFIATVKPGSIDVPGVVFAAVGCGLERATQAMESLPRIGVSHDNCPHQIILCGDESSIDIALERLRGDGVLGQKLPFRSGFHSPLFQDYVEPHRENFGRLRLEPARAELWSATSVAPYPSDAPAIRELALEHLVRPVRFREVVEALYAKGVRVFVQVGTGSLVNFVEDTLRGRSHMAISANVKERSGLSQLRRLAAALFIEGLDPVWEKISAPAPRAARSGTPLALGVPLVRTHTSLPRSSAPIAPAPVVPGPLSAMFQSSMEEILRAQSEVLAGLNERTKASGKLRPRESTSTRIISLETFPEIIDHCFYRQPAGWENLADRQPIVPMTTLLEIMIEAAQALVPERKAVGAEEVRAFRWLAIPTPVEARITCEFDGETRVTVTISSYCEATIVFAEEYPARPALDAAPLARAERVDLTGRELYDDRWLFHGPQFQGIVDLGEMGDDGMRSTIEVPAGRGALLDNAGQLFGYWVMAKNEVNRMAFPVLLSRVHFYAPPPRVGERVECTVRITRHAEREVTADLTLAVDGEVCARIEHWEHRRFDTDARLWQVLLFPEKNLLAKPLGGGAVALVDSYRFAPTRDQIMRRFLHEAERAQFEKQTPRTQRAWLGGRIAAKDAVRDAMWKRGRGDMFPAEVTIEEGPTLLAHVRGEASPFHVSTATKEDLTVAIVSETPGIGIELEKIEPRAADGEELKLVADGDRDEWLARIAVAKLALAKAKGGDPRLLAIRDRAHERILIDTTWVETRRHGDFVIGWTL